MYATLQGLTNKLLGFLSMFRSLVLLASVIQLASCTIKNVTDNTNYSSFVEQCYSVKADSFLYSLNSCSSESQICYGIQSYKAAEHLPKNENEVLENLNNWNSDFNRWARVGGLKESEFSGTVEIGTKAKVKNILYGDNGTLGKYWFVEVELLTGKHKGKLIELSSPYHLMAPYWVGHSRELQGPRLVNKYIEECSET